MRNPETGEFELVVGNTQLLSAFFILVLLLAVFFAMGYIFGQNSPHSAKVQADNATTVTEPTPVPDSRPEPSSAAPPPQQPPAATDTANPPAQTPAMDNSPQPTTQPARQPDVAQPAPAPAAITPPAAKPPVPVPAAAADGLVQELPPGSYWQVRALNRAAGAIVVRTLKEKGFPTVMTPGPNNLVRVLVGPYPDTQALGRAKTELESAGFSNPIRR